MLVIVWDRTLEPVLFKDRERQKDKATYRYMQSAGHTPHTHTHTHTCHHQMPPNSKTCHLYYTVNGPAAAATDNGGKYLLLLFLLLLLLLLFLFLCLLFFICTRLVPICGNNFRSFLFAHRLRALHTRQTLSTLGTLSSLLNAHCCWWQAYAPHSVASTEACAARGSSGFSLCSLLMTFEWF